MEENVGDSRENLEHTEKLNFCQATIAEIQRVGEVAVSSLQHRVTQEVSPGHLNILNEFLYFVDRSPSLRDM